MGQSNKMCWQGSRKPNVLAGSRKPNVLGAWKMTPSCNCLFDYDNVLFHLYNGFYACWTRKHDHEYTATKSEDKKNKKQWPGQKHSMDLVPMYHIMHNSKHIVCWCKWDLGTNIGHGILNIPNIKPHQNVKYSIANAGRVLRRHPQRMLHIQFTESYYMPSSE